MKAKRQRGVCDLRKLQVVQCGQSFGAHWEVVTDVAGKVGMRSLIIIRVLGYCSKEFGLYLERIRG